MVAKLLSTRITLSGNIIEILSKILSKTKESLKVHFKGFGPFQIFLFRLIFNETCQPYGFHLIATYRLYLISKSFSRSV